MTAAAHLATRRRGRALAVALLCALAPALVTIGLVRWHLGSEVGRFVPDYWNDQTGYWHYVLSFAEVGLASGYYAPDERPARADFLPTDIHGPLFQVVYGTVARVTGWDRWTSIPFNMAVLALGYLAYAWASRLGPREVALGGALILTTWPVLLYVPTSSQESLHQAVALALAAPFAALVRGEQGRWGTAALAACLAVLALMRLSWGLLLFPCLLLAAPPTRRGRWSALGLALAANVAIVLLFRAMTPPGLNTVMEVAGSLATTPFAALPALALGVARNFASALLPGAFASWSMFGGPTGIQFLLHVEVLVLAAVSVARFASRERIFHVLNAGAVGAACLVAYLPSGYHRVLAPHLLLSGLVLLRSGRWRLVAALVTANVLFAPSFLRHYAAWAPNFALDPGRLDAEKAELARALRYQPGAPSAWCNTLLLPVSAYDHRVTLVPAGIGISYALGAPLAMPIRSRYVLLTGDGSTLERQLDTERLRLLSTHRFGRLYVNLDAACPPMP